MNSPNFANADRCVLYSFTFVIMERYFTFWRRLAAGIFDSFILFVYSSAPLSLIQVNDQYSIFLMTTGLSIMFILYNVLLTGLFGNTVGKLVMGIKVLDLDEVRVIGVKRAFIRDLVPIILQVAGLLILGLSLFPQMSISENFSAIAENVVQDVAFYWLVLELVTMFLNSKKRSVPDLLASSVVISLKGLTMDRLDEELAAKRFGTKK